MTAPAPAPALCIRGNGIWPRHEWSVRAPVHCKRCKKTLEEVRKGK